MEATNYLSSIADRLRAKGVKVETNTVEGRSADQILQIADREGVEVIVLTAHGGREKPRFRLGSTAQKVSQHARQSLLLVRSELGEEPSLDCPIKRGLVMLDGSACAESSLPKAIELARKVDMEVILGHIAIRPVLPTCEPPTRQDCDLLQRLSQRNLELARSYLSNVKRNLQQQGVSCHCVVVECDGVRHGILRLAQEQCADLILLASHGHTASEQVVHGGVTQQVLMYAKQPVWVIQNVHLKRENMGEILHREELRLNLAGANGVSHCSMIVHDNDRRTRHQRASGQMHKTMQGPVSPDSCRFIA